MGRPKGSKNITEPCFCQRCGEQYKPWRRTQKYCSLECTRLARRNRVQCTCEVCGKEFEVRRSQVVKGGGKYCSVECKRIGWAQWIQNENPNWKPKVQLNCQNCGRFFWMPPSLSVQKFCNRACAAEWRSKHIKGTKHPRWNRVAIACEYCGKEMMVAQCHRDIKRFCSRECKGWWHSENLVGPDSPGWKGGPTTLYCKECEKPFEAWPSTAHKQRFCCKVCHSVWMSKHQAGPNSVHWKGGLSFEPYPPEFNNALKWQIRERDNYTCQLCGMKESDYWRKLDVHHIDSDKSNCNSANLITLCSSCNIKATENEEYWQVYFHSSLFEHGIKD